MVNKKNTPWCPFRPSPDDINNIAADVADIPAIQQKLCDKHPDLHLLDRVAHQYQIAGSQAVLTLANDLPTDVAGIGLFQSGTKTTGVGRISTGLGTPHNETNPDFLGLMLAFQAKDQRRVDFLAINDPGAPTDDHLQFMHVLHATAASAGEKMPFIGDWGEYDLGNLIAEQKDFGLALKDRMGWLKSGKTLAHIARQTFRTFRSSTAYQSYWTGILELDGKAGKFTLIPQLENQNSFPGFRPGSDYLTREWATRQSRGDIVFKLYWIAYLNEKQTSSTELTHDWEEEHKQLLGTVCFPHSGTDPEQTELFAILTQEMGANPGNWVHDRNAGDLNPSTAFGIARKLAYQKSQAGRNALDPETYQCVFDTGAIDDNLATELRKRKTEKDSLGHRSWASEADPV